MSWRRTLAWIALGLVVVALFAIAVDRGVRRSNDFDNFHDAATSVWKEGELFLAKGTLRYPASFQVMMSPLGALPIGVAAGLWALLNLACYGALVWLLARWADVRPRRQVLVWFGVLPFLVSNVTLGQSGPLLVALAVGGVLAAGQGRAPAGGAALAVAALLKVFPAALMAVPVFLRRAGGAIGGALAAGVVVALWVVVAIGPGAALDDLARWIVEVREEQRPDRLIEVVRSLRYNNQGLAITLVRTLTTDFAVLPQKAAKGSVQLASLPQPAVWGLYYGIVAAMAGTWLATALRLRQREPTPRTLLGLAALSIPLMLAVSPIVWTHYFLWWLPVLAFLARRERLLGAVGAISLAGIFSETARGLGLHMGITLLLFVVVARDLWSGPAGGDATAHSR